MRLFLAIMALGASAAVSAQDLGGGKSISVPKSLTPLPASTPASTSRFGSFPEPKPSSSLDIKPANSGFGKSSAEFQNPHTDVEKKLNKQNYQVYDVEVKRNQYLGEIRTKSKIGRIIYRDYDQIDGDVIRIYVNGELSQNQVILDREFHGFDITFKDGGNMIEFESLSEGYAPPNTAELVVLDEDGNVLFQNGWAIANGYKASINIIKEY